MLLRIYLPPYLKIGASDLMAKDRGLFLCIKAYFILFCPLPSFGEFIQSLSRRSTNPTGNFTAT